MIDNPSSFRSEADITQQTKTKYESPPDGRGGFPVYLEYGPELPPRYGRTFIYAMIRDPECIFVYWELTSEKIIEVFVNSEREALKYAKWVLRVYNILENNHSDIFIPPPSAFDHRDSNWYLQVLPDTEYAVEIGVILPDGRYVSFSRSNNVKTPRKGFAFAKGQEEIWSGSSIFGLRR